MFVAEDYALEFFAKSTMHSSDIMKHYASEKSNLLYK